MRLSCLMLAMLFLLTAGLPVYAEESTARTETDAAPEIAEQKGSPEQTEAAEQSGAAEQTEAVEQNGDSGQNAAAEQNGDREQNGGREQNGAPERAVALAKSNAELWLLAGGELAATSDDAMGLAGIGEDTVSLGDMDHVSLEALAALDPDLLIVFAAEPPQKALGEAAQEIGIPVVFTNIDGFEDYEQVMKDFTDLTGRQDLYEENVVKVREETERVIAAVPEDKEEKTYLLLHVSATRSKAEKNDYFACEIFNRLGLVNIASDGSSFNELSMEAILAADPDYIFVVPRGDEKKALDSFAEIFENDPSWEELTAVLEENYMLLSKDLFGLKPNARWGEAYRQAYALLYE